MLLANLSMIPYLINLKSQTLLAFTRSRALGGAQPRVSILLVFPAALISAPWQHDFAGSPLSVSKILNQSLYN